jgi:hypothetical protein
MWWRRNLFRQCSLNSDACPPDATLATLLIQPLLTDRLEGLEAILNALVEGGQMRFPGSVDRAGFGHRFVHRQTGEEGGSNSEGPQRARGVPRGLGWGKEDRSDRRPDLSWCAEEQAQCRSDT